MIKLSSYDLVWSILSLIREIVAEIVVLWKTYSLNVCFLEQNHMHVIRCINGTIFEFLLLIIDRYIQLRNAWQKARERKMSCAPEQHGWRCASQSQVKLWECGAIDVGTCSSYSFSVSFSPLGEGTVSFLSYIHVKLLWPSTALYLLGRELARTECVAGPLSHYGEAVTNSVVSLYPYSYSLLYLGKAVRSLPLIQYMWGILFFPSWACELSYKVAILPRCILWGCALYCTFLCHIYSASA